MKNIYLQFSSDINIHFQTNEDINIHNKDLLLLNAYLPGVKIISKIPKSIDLKIKFVRSKRKNIIRKRKVITIHEDWDKNLPLDFYHFLYSLVRIKWMKKNIFPVHSACFKIKKNILLIGHSGAGKTSTLLETVKKYNAQIFSGNKTLIKFKRNGIPEAVAGSKTISVRSNEKGRKIFSLKDDQYLSKNIPIEVIVIARLNDGVKEYEKIEPLSALHRLYPYFMDTVNADTLMCNGEYVFIGTAPTGTQKKLSAKLKKALSKIPVYHLSGSMDFISKKLKTL